MGKSGIVQSLISVNKAKLSSVFTIVAHDGNSKLKLLVFQGHWARTWKGGRSTTPAISVSENTADIQSAATPIQMLFIFIFN